METTIQNVTKENAYTISYFAWIPSYRDFDYDDITINAESEELAWNEFNKIIPFVKAASITHINNQKVN